MTSPSPAYAVAAPAVPVLSVAAVVLPDPDRPVNLQVRVSAPITGPGLPVVLLSHGHGASAHLSSLDGYRPLADFWAAHGFVVVQPTHLSSTTLRLDPAGPGAPLYWRARVRDMSFVLDHLDAIEAAVPQLHGRLDRDKIAVAGHSLGGHTASVLLGARLTDPADGSEVDLVDRRIRAGLLMAAPGRGGEALTPAATAAMPFVSTMDFSTMETPALVVLGDQDASPALTTAGPGWHADPYALAPSPKSKLTLFGAEHSLGGVSGYDVAETTDADPLRVEAVSWLTWAYLRSELDADPAAWQRAQKALASAPEPQGRVESK